MNEFAWADGVDVAMTVCDRDGIILYMNEKAAATFSREGGRALVGTNLMACHPEPARRKIRDILASRRANTYTIEKNGVHKLIHQAPWYQGGEPAGLVEFSVVLPAEMPHYKRN